MSGGFDKGFSISPLAGGGGGGGGGSVTAVTATSPLASSGGTAPDISIAAGTTPGDVLTWDGSAWAPNGIAAYDQMLYVADGADAALANGSPIYPFASISAALASITDATPTKRYTILITAGEYTEAGTVNLKPNVFLCGVAPDAVRITAASWGLDATFTGAGDNRTGIHNCIVTGAVSLNFTTVTSTAGKFYARSTLFNSAVTLTGYNNPIVQAQFSGCQFFGLVTVQGVNVGVANDNIHFAGLTLTQSPFANVPTIWAATGGTLGGTLTATTTVNDFNRRISVFAKSFWMNAVTITGPSTYLDYTSDCLPVAGATVTGGASLVLINPPISAGADTALSNLIFPTAVNQPIIPASTNATNMGDWNKQWFFSFGYVHLSSATDLYVASAGAAAAPDSAGRSIYIESDTYGLDPNVNGGDISLTTQAGVSGTGVRGKIALNSNRVEINGAYKLPSADGSSGQVMATDGAGQASWTTPAAIPSTLTGNMLWVDAVNGNDSTAARGNSGLPYLTVSAALAASLSGDVVMVRPGTYNVATTLTLPTGVSLRGYNRDITTIQKLGVTASTTLLTMGESSSVRELRLKLTSAGHYTLKGILWPGTTTSTAFVDTVYVEVDNSTAGDAGTSNVYGFHVTATSTPARITAVACNDVIVNVDSAGLGNKRGVLLDTSVSYLRNESCTYSCVRTGAGAGSYIGGEVNIAGGILAMNAGGYEGTSADMSETAGSLEVLGTDLTNDNANGKGFRVTQASPRFTWGVVGPLPSGTKYLYPGTAQESSNEVFTRLAEKGIIKSLTVRARIAPGAGSTDVYTLRKNGVNTALTVSLVGTATSVQILTASVSFAASDDLSISAVSPGTSASTDIIVVAEIY